MTADPTIALLDDEIRAAVDAGKPHEARALRRFRERLRGKLPRLVRQISTLPEAEQPAAIAADARRAEHHRAAGTLPTPQPLPKEYKP